MRRARRLGGVVATLSLALALAATASVSSAGALTLVRYSGGSVIWSPDGSTLAATTGDALEVIRAGQGRAQVGSGDLGFFGFPCECPLGWSAGANQILFVSHAEEIEGDAGVGAIAPDGSGLQMQSLGLPVGDVGWGAAGFPLAYVPNSRTFDVFKGYVGPNPDLWLLDGFGAQPRKLLAERGVESGPQFSPDGSRILYQLSRGRSTSLRLIDVDGSHQRVLVPDLYNGAEYSWSPDGSWVALVATSPRDHRAHLYVVPAAGGKLRRLTREEVRNEVPAWSPDGARIAFTTFGGSIREVRRDGSGAHLLRVFPGKEVSGLAWSPHSDRLAYRASRPSHSD